MGRGIASGSVRFRAFGRHQLENMPHLDKLSRDQRIALKAVSAVFPFRVNQYVVDELIDWDDIPNDPIYQLTFPQAGMLEWSDLRRLQDLLVGGATEDEIAAEAREIQVRLNPHPAGQRELNLPSIDGQMMPGSQHKYRETVLFFPAHGQTCHAYCTYCFRWAQFVGVEGLKFASRQADILAQYVRAHPELTDVLITGGDPMVMSTKVLRRYVEPLLEPGCEHVQSIRIGTKALAYWPYRFLTDEDADDLLRLFCEVRASGRQLAVMAHFSHVNELRSEPARQALRRVIDTGAVVRCQAPLVRHVNDDAGVWAAMWQEQVRLGAVPYYMFVERNTGPKRYFEVPLARALRLFSGAYSQVSGLARTVRGPSMSATPGKVLVDGVSTIDDETVFVLKFIQARDQAWVNRLFYARFDSQAAWLTDLEPAFGAKEFFFEPYMRAMQRGRWLPQWKLDNGEIGEEMAG